jgi:aspartate/methionine/tyrosine aminotransferase
VRYQLTPIWSSGTGTDSVGALVASPANPTGTILTRDELAALSGAIKARHGHLVVDEIYHGLTYGTDAASVLEVDDEAFVLNSFSKYFGMTGWRLGWLVAPRRRWVTWKTGAEPLHQRTEHGPACRVGLFEPQTLNILEERRAEFGRRRDFCCPPARTGFQDRRRAGRAFYLYADISAFGGDAFAFCRHFLETEHGVYAGPGLRSLSGRASCALCLHKSDRLQEAVERIARGLRSWQG